MTTPAFVTRGEGSDPGMPARPDLLLSLRSWQTDAYHAYFRLPRRDFLLVATPGAGKTTFALTVAAELLARREILSITVVTPTEHLKHQWSAAAHALGIPLDSGYRNAQGQASADFTGVAVTYAQVAAHPALHRQRTTARRTFVIFDEIHHAGDALSWGEAVRDAFEPARRRLALTGTPFRSDANPIPFVTYTQEADGSQRSSSDYVYGYGPALDEGVVRPVIFLAYSGEMRWRARAGDEATGTLGTPMTPDQLALAWRTALDPDGAWILRVLEAADRRLTEVRRAMPDAAGLIIAGDHADARAYAALLRHHTGTRPVVVLSDDPSASKKISQFATSADRWMVAVRMVSEGVDIPRLAVGVYATSVGTALFFAQAVGRFVRARRRGETASVFLPSIPVLLGYAAELEAERDHILARKGGDAPEEEELAEARRRRDTPDQLDDAPFRPLEASAQFDRVLYDGAEFGASAEEEEFLGLPGLLEPEQVAMLLRKRQAAQVTVKRSGRGKQNAAADLAAAGPPGPGTAGMGTAGAGTVGAGTVGAGITGVRAGALGTAGMGTAGMGTAGMGTASTGMPSASPAAPATRETLAALRKELNLLIAAWHHRTNQPHGVIHADLRRSCGGPPLPQATGEQIRARIAMMRKWAASGR